MGNTIRRKLTKSDVRTALGMVGSEEAVFSDIQAPGLSLRVRSASAVWCLRARFGPNQTTWRIGNAQEMQEPEPVREVARDAWKLIKRGINPEDYLRAFELGGPVVRTFDPVKDGWTWETARDNYLEHVARDKAKATYTDYRVTLRSADFRPVEGLLVRQLNEQHLKTIQDSVSSRGRIAQARHCVHLGKAMLSWVADRAGSGLSESPWARVRAMEQSLVPTEPGYVPTMAELGGLPWRLEAAQLSAATRLAGLLIMFTAQRIGTVIRAQKQEFEPFSGGRGIWTIPPAHIKSKRGHVIPLPPATWDLVKQAMALSEASHGWLFPQVRPRRAGGKCDGHISAKPVSDPLDPLDPHDFRRAFATYGQVHLGMKPSDTKAILDHAEGNAGDVTALRYALHDGRHFKWGLMTVWENWLLDLAAKHCPAPGARMRTLLVNRRERAGAE